MALDSPNYGRSGWAWYTGSAAWLIRITLDQLIGIESDYDGLIVKRVSQKNGQK